MLHVNQKENITDSNNIKSEVQKIYNELVDCLNLKTDKKETEIANKKIFEDIEKKCEFSSLDNLYKTLHKEINDKYHDSRLTTNQSLKTLESDLHKALDKKANASEVTSALNSKADQGSMNTALQAKVNFNIKSFNQISNLELDAIKLTIHDINKSIISKLDEKKFEVMTSDTFNSIEEIQKDLMSKANIKEVLSLLKNKTDIEDVNKALTQIHEELDLKCSNEYVSYKTFLIGSYVLLVQHRNG